MAEGDQFVWYLHYKEGTSPLMVALEYVTANLAKCFEGTSKKLEYPELPEL